MPSLGRLAKIVLGVAISVASLVYLFWSVDPRDVLARLATTNWTFLTISLALNLLSVWIRSWRWYYLFPPGSRPSHLFNAVMIGYMANNILPLRAGEVVRVYIASRHGPRFWTSVATLVVERVLDGLAVGLILAGLFLTLPIPRELRWPAVIFLGVDVVAMAALAVIAIAPGGCATLIRVVFHRWARLERWLLDALGTMSEGLRGVRARRHLLPIAASSVGIWLVLAARGVDGAARRASRPAARGILGRARVHGPRREPAVEPGLRRRDPGRHRPGPRPVLRAAHGSAVVLAHLPRRPVLPRHPLRPRPPPRRAGEPGGSRPRHPLPVASAPR